MISLTIKPYTRKQFEWALLVVTQGYSLYPYPEYIVACGVSEKRDQLLQRQFEFWYPRLSDARWDVWIHTASAKDIASALLFSDPYELPNILIRIYAEHISASALRLFDVRQLDTTLW